MHKIYILKIKANIINNNKKNILSSYKHKNNSKTKKYNEVQSYIIYNFILKFISVSKKPVNSFKPSFFYLVLVS